MKLVIDTNVLIAAFISPSGKSSEVLEHCATFHTIVCSEYILDELREKLIGKFRRKPGTCDRPVAVCVIAIARNH